jgi:hypothetical protein
LASSHVGTDEGDVQGLYNVQGLYVLRVGGREVVTDVEEETRQVGADETGAAAERSPRHRSSDEQVFLVDELVDHEKVV